MKLHSSVRWDGHARNASDCTSLPSTRKLVTAPDSTWHWQGGFAAMASYPHALEPDIDDFNTLTLRVKSDGFSSPHSRFAPPPFLYLISYLKPRRRQAR